MTTIDIINASNFTYHFHLHVVMYSSVFCQFKYIHTVHCNIIYHFDLFIWWFIFQRKIIIFSSCNLCVCICGSGLMKQIFTIVYCLVEFFCKIYQKNSNMFKINYSNWSLQLFQPINKITILLEAYPSQIVDIKLNINVRPAEFNLWVLRISNI